MEGSTVITKHTVTFNFGCILSKHSVTLPLPLQPMQERILAAGTIATTVSTLIALITLFFWTATSDIFEFNKEDDRSNDNGDGNYQKHWWNQEWDLKREEQSVLKVKICICML